MFNFLHIFFACDFLHSRSGFLLFNATKVSLENLEKSLPCLGYNTVSSIWGGAKTKIRTFGP